MHNLHIKQAENAASSQSMGEESKQCTLTKPASFFDSQIFCQDDDGSGNPRYFAVAPMASFAKKHLLVSDVKADPNRAAAMIKERVVNVEHLARLTGKKGLEPIILCLGAEKNGGDLIIDGNHRYVVWTFGLKEAGRRMVVPAYLLEKELWEQFIVPADLVPQMGLSDPAIAKFETCT